MTRHLTYNDLIAAQTGQLTPEEKAQVDQHLSECAQCAQSAELLPELIKRGDDGTKQKQGAPSRSCLSHEAISAFLNGELSFWQERKAEKHLATCDSCRERLADIIRASFKPLSHTEKGRIKDDPKLSLGDQTRAIENLFEEEALPSRESFWEKLHRVLGSRFSLRVAWVVVAMSASTWLAVPKFAEWRATQYVLTAQTLMQKTYSVAHVEFQPDGFPTGMFSEHHGSTPQEKISAIESNLQKALSWNKKNRAAKRARALLCYFEHNYVCADTLLRALLQDDRRDYAAWNNLGVLAAQREDTTAALAAFEQAIALRPDYAEALHNRRLLQP